MKTNLFSPPGSFNGRNKYLVDAGNLQNVFCAAGRAASDVAARVFLDAANKAMLMAA